jgi:hypothetical protein
LKTVLDVGLGRTMLGDSPTGPRWHVQECFQQAKNEAGLGHYRVRYWRPWRAHITLSMLALAWLATSEPRPSGEASTSDPGMSGCTFPEMRRVLMSEVYGQASTCLPGSRTRDVFYVLAIGRNHPSPPRRRPAGRGTAGHRAAGLI